MQTDKEKSCPNKQDTIVLNEKARDSAGKVIFDDSILCAQFLNDYVKVLGDITVYPENIEDVSERYVPLSAEERNSDIVKKIKIPNKVPFYFISLIEHKTKVDYNVGIQIFRYIYQIWEDYEKEMEKEHKGISKTKDFKYPPVIPIVYYEGKQRWTAPLQLKEKIAMQEVFGEMIPNFAYQLVSLNDYSNEELLNKGDAISLMMLLNKIKSADDIERFMKISADRLNAIVEPLPEYLIKKIAQIFRVWLYAMNTPEDEVEEIVSRVEEKDRARLFEGMEVDIQAERKKLHAERQKFAEEKQKLVEKEEKIMKAHINAAYITGKSESQIVEELKEIFELDEEVAVEKVKQFRK